jgi:phosphoglycolate phosphatase
VGDLQRLIAFDLDGTLVDSRRDLAESANLLIAELGGRPLTQDAIGRMVGEGAGLLVRRALAGAGLASGLETELSTGLSAGVGAGVDEAHAGALARFLEIYDDRLLNHTCLYPGVVDAVHRARSCARVTVLTNKPLAPTLRILEAFGLRDLFDDVVGGDGPHPRKPDPAGLLAMMAATGASGERTLMVGDSAFDRETARRAGARCCLVSYGFGFHTVAAADAATDGAAKNSVAARECVVADAQALTGVIDGFARATRETR